MSGSRLYNSAGVYVMRKLVFLSAALTAPPEEMFGRTRFPRIGELPYLLTLGPRGFFWFQLRKDESE